MKDNIINFHCTKCKSEWEGLFVPLYCPNCESVLGITVLTDKEKYLDNRKKETT